MSLTVVLNRDSGYSASSHYHVEDQEFDGPRLSLGWHVEKNGALVIITHNPDYENTENDNFVGEPLAEFSPGSWLFVREQDE